MTGQAYGSPFTPKKPAKTMYDKEWYANGAVLSEFYLRYSIGKTDIIAGRQYYARHWSLATTRGLIRRRLRALA